MRWLIRISILLALGTLGAAESSTPPLLLASATTAQPSAETTANLREYPYGGQRPVEVSIGLYITNLAVVEETREQFEVEGYFTLEWQDPRLALPAKSRRPYHFRQINPDEIWTPDIETSNMISHHRGSFRLTADDAGNLHYVERTDTTVSTSYSLRKFPFDSQVLEFRIEPFLPASAEMVFAERPAQLTGIYPDGNSGLAAWRVRGLRYQNGHAGSSSTVPARPQAVFQILISRRSGFYVWKIFLPIILLTIIPWAVFWYEVQDFSGQMNVPLAIIIAMVAFQLAVTKDLPRVGYITYLDAVFLTSFIFVFLCIVEIVLAYVLQVRQRVEAAGKIRSIARWGFPSAYVGLLLLLTIFY